MKPIIKGLLFTVCATGTFLSSWCQTAADFVPYQKTELRLPSVPLLINDPYFSLWSNYDRLTDGPVTHWSCQEKAIDGLLRVDGTTYRFMGTGRQNLLAPIAGMTVDDAAGWSGAVNYDVQAGTDWAQPTFDDSSWAVEEAAWGTTPEYPNVKNEWKGNNKDIYVRRKVNLTADDLQKDLWVKFSHDDVFEMYINGQQVVKTGTTWKQGEQQQLTAAQRRLLHEGENVIAAHCHNTTGGSYIDFGLYANVMPEGEAIETAKQTDVNVLATSSFYSFECGPIDLDVVFTAPLLIDDLDLLSTPVNIISYQVKSRDGQPHQVQFYLATSPQLTVNEMSQPTVSEIVEERGMRYLKSGSKEQKMLGRSGDLISIDWGYLYIPAINGDIAVASVLEAEPHFAATGTLPMSATEPVESTTRANMPVLAFSNNLGNVTEARDFMLIGYDEVKDMQYMHNDYKAYYARNGKTIFEAFEEFRDNYPQLMERCRQWDRRIYDDAIAVGNQRYAELLSANYRLVMGAHKLFEDNTGKPLYFSKENKSNGCVNTVDLTYPESPLYLLYNPTLMKGMVLSILDYAQSEARKGKNCAAHDLGQYPLANGQVYGDSMPLEESANILLLCDAICRVTGDGEWLKPYRNTLKTWADYCRVEGQNPGKQLCTDDFKGPSEQNTNLSVKAILAVAAYADLIPYMGGNSRDIEKFKAYARDMALIWEADALDGDHYRMEFNKGNTWSQKYNLVWDQMWGLGLFPAEVLEREMAYYLRHQLTYGVPLDGRDNQTKADWIMWTAAMAPDDATFTEMADRVYRFADETPSRIPMTDYYWADAGRDCNFSARSVLGGMWMRELMKKYKPEATLPTVWEPKGNHIKTRWAADVDPENVLPEYPRPQMRRARWQNLNGLWDYAITEASEQPTSFDGKILVPFALESSLSGVMKPLEPGKALWYRREIEIPQEWEGQNVVLNFGGVDYQADVYVGGTTGRYRVAQHKGGHSGFAVDITPRIKDSKATVYVRVVDDMNEYLQPVGKQRRYAKSGIFYTATSGIWKPVWMEPVAKTHVEHLAVTPDIDAGTMTFDMAITGTPTGSVDVRVKDGQQVVATKSTPAVNSTASVVVDMPDAKLWGPKSPFLYSVELKLSDAEGNTLDSIQSYGAMRKIGYANSDDGYWRLQLNNQDLFQFGPLDQGYWPDGLMTAPTDEALRYDIEKTKELGFNMIRKHMKTETDRWYFHCDSLGMLVWQDMPSLFEGHEDWVTHTWYPDHDCRQNATAEANYRSEWREIIEQLYSHPSIVVWTPFNEHWGQFKTAEITELTQQLDPTRLVNPASGGNHYHLGEGTIVDQHTYGQPIELEEGIYDANRPLVLGEYGGLGRNMPGNRWYERNSETYNTYPNEEAVTDAFVALADQIARYGKGYEKDGKKHSYSAAVYTQTTDVETEVNGFMTYDREKVKFNEPRFRQAAEKLTGLYDKETAVAVPFVDGVAGEPLYYNILGMRLQAPCPGVNIVKEADGTTRKVLIP